MNVSEIIALVFLCIGGLGAVLCLYMLCRNVMVCKFRRRILHEDYEAYSKLSDYDKMLYSLKPLKLKYWIK